jgi:L-fuculose-phosphate aldolase
LVKVAHQIYQSGLTPGKSGNISMKLCPATGADGEKNPKTYRKCIVLITPSGVSLNQVSLKNVIVTDLDGNQVEGEGKPSSEINMHLEIYEKRIDVQGIVHTHSPYATGFSFTSEKIPRLEGFGKIKDPYIKVVDYASPGSDKLVELASHGLQKEDVLILKNHGVLAVGLDLDEAAALAEFIENCAKTGFVTLMLTNKKN